MRRRTTKSGFAGCAALVATALLAAPALASWSPQAWDGSRQGGDAGFFVRAGFERGGQGQGDTGGSPFGRTSQGQEQAQSQATGEDGQGNGHGSQSQGSQPGQSSGSQTTPSATGATLSAQGVVQSSSSTAITVRQLDGSVVAVPLGRQTELIINGKQSRVAEVRAGDVLVATWTSGQAATVVHLYSAS